ncbi:MAG: enoyl-CoA hydratase [Chloroflexi bacterium]|nr:enoyl-CoA hydratase [Chloroflexota bacterium]
MNDTVLVERRDDGVALVTLNRPESLNAMNTDLSDALRAALAELAEDAAVRCVALTGQGRAFSAGGDVKSMRERSRQEGIGPDGEYHADVAIRTMQARQLETSGLLHTMPKPTVALVNGYAIGAGFCFALACDVRLCSEKAKFGMAFRNVGLPADDFLAEGLAYAGRLAQGPTKALGRMKANLNRSAEGAGLEEVLMSEAINTRMSRDDHDHAGAVEAFIRGDKPVFSGR